MAGSMGQADLIADLKSALNDAASVFTDPEDADFKRHLGTAARDLGRVRRRKLLGSLSLVAGQPDYAAPADLLCPTIPVWGVTQKMASKPWEANWPGPLPRLLLVELGGGLRELHLLPAPTAGQIGQFGSNYGFYYNAGHSVGLTPELTTVSPLDRDLLLLRAAAEAMREVAYRNSKKPVQLRDGLQSAPRNQTAAAIAEWLMAEFERRAA